MYPLRQEECPDCGGEANFKGDYIEGTDRDGNRGIVMEYYECRECGIEFSVPGELCGRQF